MPRPAKTAAVEEITGRFNESNAALLTEYRGLTVGEIQELRRALRAADTDYKVLKNTLTRIAVKEAGLDELTAHLVGPTAIAFVKGDAVAAAKALDEAAKKYPVLVIKGGVIDGKFIDADQTKALARLEPREVQLAKIAMLMNTPLQQTVNVFAALLRDLGSMLAQVIAKKESGELPGGTGEAPAAEAPAAEAPAAEESVAAAEPEAAEAEPVAEAAVKEPAAPEAEAAEAVAEPEPTTAEAAEESVEAASDTEEETAEGGQDKEE